VNFDYVSKGLKNLRRGFPVKLCFKGSGKKLLEKITNFGYVSKILKNLRRGFPVKLCFKGSGKKFCFAGDCF